MADLSGEVDPSPLLPGCVGQVPHIRDHGAHCDARVVHLQPKTGTVKLAMPADRRARTPAPSAPVQGFWGHQRQLRSDGDLPAFGRAVGNAGQLVNGGAQSPVRRSAHYAAKERADTPSGSAYDICDTSVCQVYKDNSGRVTNTDKAITATAGKVVLYKGQLALTQFSSSNGGWSASGSGLAYLAAKKDPYDPVKTWTKTITGASFEKAYPKIGTFSSVQITARQDVGPYSGAGRVSSVKITGSAGSVTVSGGSFKSKFGLKETLFSFTSNTVNTTKK